MSNETEMKDFLKREAASTRKGGTILLVFGVSFVPALIGLYTYTLSRLHTEWNSEKIIEFGMLKMPVYLDAAIKGGEDEVLKRAPGLMDQAKDQLIKYMPEGRKRLEDLLAKAADDLSEKVREQASEQIEQVMLTHGPEIRAALEAAGDIQKSEDAKENLKAVLEEEFEKVAVRDLDPRVHEYLQALEDMDTELTVLVETPVEKLTPERQLERELLQIVYTLIERNYARFRGLGTTAAGTG